VSVEDSAVVADSSWLCGDHCGGRRLLEMVKMEWLWRG